MSKLKHAVYRTISKTARLFQARLPAGQRVLLYHSVGGQLPRDPYGTAIEASSFKEHLNRLDSLRGEFKPNEFGVPKDPSPSFSVVFDDGYSDNLKTAAPELAKRGLPFTVFIVPDFLGTGGGLYLDRAGLKELAAFPGASIGAHGARHVRLTDLNDPALAEELSSSRKKLEDLLASPVQTMSYPFGAVDRRVRDAAQAAGFVLAGSSRYGSNRPDRDPLLLKRTEIVSWDSADDMELKLRGFWDWFAWRRPDPANAIIPP